MPAAPPLAAIQRARSGVRRTALRHQLLSVASGKATAVALDLQDGGVEVALIVEEVTRRLEPDSVPLQLLGVAFRNSRTTDAVIERLSARSIKERVAAARIVGALRISEATPWLSPLLAARDPSVADAAARALGKIGGTRSATALLFAIQRRGMSRRLVSELARAAPDLFIEVALMEASRPSLRPALAIAAGLRRRRTAIGQLIALLEQGSRKERVISCRALGWIGASSAAPMIREALEDRDWKMRMSAAKALGALRAAAYRRDLEDLLADRNPRVRKAAQQALHKFERPAAPVAVNGA